MKKVYDKRAGKKDESRNSETIEVTMCDECDFIDWLIENEVEWKDVGCGTYQAVDVWGNIRGYYKMMNVETLREEMKLSKADFGEILVEYIIHQFKKINNIENTTTCLKIEETAKNLHDIVNIAIGSEHTRDKFHNFIDLKKEYYLSLPEQAVKYDIECFANACSSVAPESDEEYERLLFDALEKAVRRTVKGEYCSAQLNEIITQCSAIMNEHKFRKINF